MESVVDVKSKVRGRPFTKGNGGRKPGSKNRVTRVAAALLEGEEQELVGKAVELAKAGDVAMLKFLLSRILPRERRIQIELPSATDHDRDPAATMAKVIGAVTEGKISPSEGASIASLLESFRRTLELVKVVERLDKFEADLAKVKQPCDGTRHDRNGAWPENSRRTNRLSK
jgi:hypothetical protein